MVGVIQGRLLLRYAGILLMAFFLLYVRTRSSILIGDAKSFVAMARGGDPAEIHYGEPGHFLQIPMARAVWRAARPAVPRAAARPMSQTNRMTAGWVIAAVAVVMRLAVAVAMGGLWWRHRRVAAR